MKFKTVFEEIMTSVWAWEKAPERDFKKEADPKNIKSTGFTDIGNSGSVYARELLGPKAKGIKPGMAGKIASSKRTYEE